MSSRPLFVVSILDLCYLCQHFGLVFHWLLSALWTCVISCQHFGLVFYILIGVLTFSLFNLGFKVRRGEGSSVPVWDGSLKLVHLDWRRLVLRFLHGSRHNLQNVGTRRRLLPCHRAAEWHVALRPGAQVVEQLCRSGRAEKLAQEAVWRRSFM